jgi:ribonuclease VapC
LIVVDTSAIIAILWRGFDWERLWARLADANGAVISTGSVLELQLVLAGVRASGSWDQVEALFNSYRITIRQFDETRLRIARQAALRFGKGRHEAALNFGDCFAYALSRAEGPPLPCKGGDFALTDIELA